MPARKIGYSAIRTFAWLAGTALALPLGTGTVVAAEPEAKLYTPPMAHMLLTRSLHRPLHDGAEVITRRTYQIRISRDGEGFRVDGTLVGSAVEAPSMLRALADIERNRSDNGLFPIFLDRRGQIVGTSGAAADGSLDRAARLAAEQIGGSGLAAIDMLQAQSFIGQIRSRTARSQWPADVFNPAKGKRSESRVVPLPDGNQGQVVIEINARRASAAGQLSAVERIVTTDLLGSKRVTREEWQLSKLTSQFER